MRYARKLLIPLRNNKINRFNLVTMQQQGINVFFHVILVNYLHIYRFDPVTMNTVSFCKTKLSWSIFSFTNNYCQVYIFIWDTYHLLHDLIYIDLTLLPFCEALEVSSPSPTTTAKFGLMYLYRTLLSPRTRPWECTCSETTRQIHVVTLYCVKMKIHKKQMHRFVFLWLFFFNH